MLGYKPSFPIDKGYKKYLNGTKLFGKMNFLNKFKKLKPLIIAEIGNNHEGNFENALKLIDAAKKTGVDAVKFQTFKTDLFIQIKTKIELKDLKNLNYHLISFQN